MAHSAENFTTLESILAHYSPLEVRYFLLATHYRSSLTFTVETGDGDSSPRVRGIEDVRGALSRLRRALGEEPLGKEGPLDQATVDAFTAAMDADFNTPDALAVIFDLAREINRCREASASSTEVDVRRRTLVYLLDVLGLSLDQARPATSGEPFVELLLDVRRQLRDMRQFALADHIRGRLRDLGIVVEDQPDGGSTWYAESVT